MGDYCIIDRFDQCFFNCKGCDTAKNHNYEPDPDEEYERERDDLLENNMNLKIHRRFKNVETI